MKIEIGESLICSWLKHVKECQIVQSNWTTAQEWTLYNKDKLEIIKENAGEIFNKKYGYEIYKKTASLKQFLQQAECDVLGIAVQNTGDEDDKTENKYYAVDVAFHENGLQYGSLDVTVQKVIAKCIRTAMCIYGYLRSNEAEIIFASPKINKKLMQKLESCIADLQSIMNQENLHFTFRIIANESFKESILESLLAEEKKIADTNELFVRSFQMLQLYDMLPKAEKDKKGSVTTTAPIEGYHSAEMLSEFKVGKLVQNYMRPILESGKVSEQEIKKLREKDYCKRTLNISFPLLVKPDEEYNHTRYYVEPVTIAGEKYMICSQWYERAGNNDKRRVINWIQDHS